MNEIYIINKNLIINDSQITDSIDDHALSYCNTNKRYANLNKKL
jgi:hypothetical protein